MRIRPASPDALPWYLRPIIRAQRRRYGAPLESATLLERGMSREKPLALDHWRGSEMFSETERAALEYAEAMTVTDRDVDDALFGRVRARFDAEALVELTALIAFQNMSSKFNSALAIPPQGFCILPDADDLQDAPAERAT